MNTPADVTAPESSAEGSSDDALHSFRNAVKLAGSLIVTWGIALGVRLLLPRYLGPAAFGSLNFADNFTGMLFGVMGLGADTYIRKEIPVRGEHANDFMGGLLLSRLLIAGILYAGLALILPLTDQPEQTRNLVFCFGIFQIFFITNNTLAALLHARSRVDGLSVVNIVTKLVWGAGLITVIVVSGALPWVVAAFLMSEAARTALLWTLVRRETGLRLAINPRALMGVVIASLPFFVNGLAVDAYGKINISVLNFVVTDTREVGWYGAANTLGGLALMLTPMLGWVMMPLFSRARARSMEEFENVVRRSLEFMLIIAVPISLALGVGANLWMPKIFGPAFAPASQSLRFLAPVFALAYVNVIGAQALMILDRGWSVTLISVCGLVLACVLNVVLIPVMARTLGNQPGNASAGAAFSVSLSETFVAICMLWMIGRGIFDRRAVQTLLRNLAACGLSIIAYLLLHTSEPNRVGIAAFVYLVALVLFRAVPVAELIRFVRAAVSNRHATAAS